MSRITAPIALALGGLMHLAGSVGASQARLDRHWRSGALAAKQGPLGTPVPSVPGTYLEWQKWSELLVLRNRSIGGDKEGFVFCALPKNGCTVWKQLMLRAMGSHHWNTENKTLVHNPEASGLDLVGSGLRIPMQQQHDLYDLLGPGSKTYKAVMVRDPIPRFLSAYLDRCVDMKEWYRCKAGKDASFEEVIVAYESGGYEDPDLHFTRQTHLCGIQYHNFTTWDTFAKYEDFADESERVLKAAGLWEEFGSSGWGADRSSPFGVEEQAMSNHKTEHNAEDLVCEYYTPDLLKRVAALYEADSTRFGYRPVYAWTTQCASAWENRDEEGAVGERRLVTMQEAAINLPGELEEWQQWSELMVLRQQPISDTKEGFVFCALPKSGSSVWKQLMLRAMGSDHWRTVNKTLVHDPQESGLDLVGHGLPQAGADPSDIIKLMGPGSKTYKAAIVRDPITHVLAAYLDRCVDLNEWSRCKTKPGASFDEVIAAYETGRFSDIHFGNQTYMCGLQHDNFTSYDMIGRFEDFARDSRKILEAANLWEEFGSSGWGNDGTAYFGEDVETMDDPVEDGSASQVCTYYNPGLLRRVAALYWPDIEHFNYDSVKTWTKACAHVWQ